MERGERVALAIAPSGEVGLASTERGWSLPAASAVADLSAIERQLRPRWTWWSQDVPLTLTRAGLRVATCWDLSAVHRILFGRWQADPARIWAALHDLDEQSLPATGQLDLLGSTGDDGGDPELPVRPDRHLRPEWVSGGWARTADRLQQWAALAHQVADLQEARLRRLQVAGDPAALARSESAAELLCAELAVDGLPVDRLRAEELIASYAGPRPADEAEARAIRSRRDYEVLRQVPASDGVDLRNPAQVKALLARVGIELPDTRAWRLESFRGAHPVVEELLRWRKAERISTTYGYGWLEDNVGSDARLRGGWSGSDGAAGRMTATVGLHNLPADLRSAVAAQAGHVLVRADLGQIEPRVLAAVSGDAALARATADDDLYAPVAARLGVERPIAKVAVLAAMYGQTSGAAGEALRGLESAYPVAMRYLKDAYESGRAGRDVRTYGGRLVRMWPTPDGLDADAERSQAAARGRYARNAVIQGAAAELFKAWAVTVRARAAALDSRIVLCLHDELLLHAPEHHADAVVGVMHDCLAEASARWAPAAPRVRFVADVSVIRRWSEAKG